LLVHRTGEGQLQAARLATVALMRAAGHPNEAIYDTLGQLGLLPHQEPEHPAHPIILTTTTRDPACTPTRRNGYRPT
jgi:hypothetical protein